MQLIKSETNPFPALNVPQFEVDQAESAQNDQDDNLTEKSPERVSGEPKPEEMIKTGSFKKLLSARSSSPD